MYFSWFKECNRLRCSLIEKFRATSHRSDNLIKRTRTWRSLWRRFRANSRDVSNIPVSFFLATNDRISQRPSTSSSLVPSLLFPDDSAFLRIEDEVPSAMWIPFVLRSCSGLVSRWSRRSRRWRRWKDSEIPPRDGGRRRISRSGDLKSLSSYEQRAKDYRFNGSHWIRIFRFSLNFEGKELPAYYVIRDVFELLVGNYAWNHRCA